MESISSNLNGLKLVVCDGFSKCILVLLLGISEMAMYYRSVHAFKELVTLDRLTLLIWIGRTSLTDDFRVSLKFETCKSLEGMVSALDYKIELSVILLGYLLTITSLTDAFLLVWILTSLTVDCLLGDLTVID